jgi:hypothetical protein
LLALAYDIYCIYHCAELPEELIARLKNKDQFQGAKYEIAVAGIFVRAGFTIEWLPKSPQKRCEFIATHKKTEEKIYVEAKSRHRKGVFYTPGKMKSFSKMKADVHHLFNEALSKPVDGNSFMIFVDLNLPLTEGDISLDKKWVVEIKKILDKYPKGTLENPEKYNSLFVTNFSWHYFGNQTELRKSEMVTIVPLYPKHQLKDQSTVQLLHLACEQYGSVPGMFPEEPVRSF